MSLLDIDFSQFLKELIYAIIYPLVVIFYHLLKIVQIVIGAFVGLVNSIFYTV